MTVEELIGKLEKEIEFRSKEILNIKELINDLRQCPLEKEIKFDFDFRSEENDR